MTRQQGKRRIGSPRQPATPPAAARRAPAATAVVEDDPAYPCPLEATRPDNPTHGDLMTPPRTNEALADWWDAHLRAVRRAEQADAEAKPIEADARTRTEHAEKLRADANRLNQQADEQFRMAESALVRAKELRAVEQLAKEVAEDHATAVQEACDRSPDRVHPSQQRQRRNTPPQGVPQVDNHVALDGLGQTQMNPLASPERI